VSGETRARLVAAAAQEFNRTGYHGTDSNRIARAAGYAPGTFYKHFSDKRDIFLAAWEDWVAREWRAVGEEVEAVKPAKTLAARIVELTLGLHIRWRGLRASMHALAAADPVVRRFHRAQRLRQLELLAELRSRGGVSPRAAAEDAVLLFTLERTCDAIALGETRDLGLDREALLTELRARLQAHLAPRSTPDAAQLR
jgi:AcrR family transcriptional regulator